MSRQQFAHKDVQGNEYVRERAGNEERIVQRNPAAPISFLESLKQVLGLR